MKLKEKILSQYSSISHFCFLNDISKSTVTNYINGRYEINSMTEKTLSRICTALNCFPEEIDFTKNYWWEVSRNPKIKSFKYSIEIKK